MRLSLQCHKQARQDVVSGLFELLLGRAAMGPSIRLLRAWIDSHLIMTDKPQTAPEIKLICSKDIQSTEDLCAFMRFNQLTTNWRRAG